MEQTTVQSVERTFTLIELLSRRPKGMQLAEISRETGLHKSTAHRLLACLMQMGYVSQDGISGSYRLTLKLFETSSRVVQEIDILSASKDYLDRLSETTQESVHLVVPSGTKIVYIYKVDRAPHGNVRMSSRIGLSIPMYCTGVGKAILAYLPREQVRDIWDRSDIHPLTEHTVTDWETFCRQLDEIHTQGWAVDDEENELGVRCLAVPLLDYHGFPAAAFSVSAPLSRMGEERMALIRKEALSVGDEITRGLGLLR